MSASVWGLFQAYGTGFYSGDVWIRPGHFDGAVFTWDHAAIAVPDQFSAYAPDDLWTGHLSVDPNDGNYIWVYGIVDVSGQFYARCWVYNVIAETWSLVLDVDGGNTDYAICVDMAFDSDGTAFIAIGNAGAYGLGAGFPSIQGVYMSVARGTFTAAGSGHDHAFSSGNINAVHSLTALDIAQGGEGVRKLYTAHTLARVNALAATGWVTSASTDDGASWHDPVPTYSGNQFQLECLTCMRLWAGAGGLWYVADHSGTGPYSTANLTARISGAPDDGPDGGYGGGVFRSGTICYPFTADPSLAVGFPTQHDLAGLFNSNDGGASWTETARPSGDRPGFCYRGGRTERGSLYAAGFARANDSHDSTVWWTDDAGETWYSAEAEPDAVGLSCDFGTFTPAAPRVALEVLTFRDSRMFVGQTRFYISADSDAEATANALGIADALQLLTDGAWTGATGPYTTPAGAPSVGSDAVYRNAEMVLRLVWLTEDGAPIIVEVPCPAEALFIDDQETTSILNPDYIDAVTAGFTYKICTRGGLLAYMWGGATRIMRGFRSTENIRTLDPGETSTAE